MRKFESGRLIMSGALLSTGHRYRSVEFKSSFEIDQKIGSMTSSDDLPTAVSHHITSLAAHRIYRGFSS